MVANDFERDANVLIAKVDAEAANAKATANDQGVSSYPTIKYFPAGSTVGQLYEGGRNEWDLVTWMNEKAGTYRMAGGELNVTAGTVEVLDKIVGAGKLAAAGSAIADLVALVKKEVAGITDKAQATFAAYYVRALEKASKKEGYVQKEMDRLWGILNKGGLTGEKRDEITKKVNVLRVLLEKAPEEAEKVKDEL